jgi:spore germination protein YaaH
MGWRARWAVPNSDAGIGCMDDCAKNSWTNYVNNSALTSVIICTSLNQTQVACAAKARGARALVVQSAWHHFNVSQLEEPEYTSRWVAQGVKNLKATTPWADGVNLDLEHFPRADMEKQDLVKVVCEMRAQLNAEGMRLHSMDLAPWGSWGVFNVTALAHCLDYAVPMAYCSPASSRIAGPTDPLDNLIKQFEKWGGVPRKKIIVGLPLFGYSFRCTNPRPDNFPANNTCLIAQPPQYPKITTWQGYQLFATENVTSGKSLLFDRAKASAWFEFTNRTSGGRYQVWFPDERAVATMSDFVFSRGYHGLSFWTADSLYSGLGEDSATARAIWRAAAPTQTTAVHSIAL